MSAEPPWSLSLPSQQMKVPFLQPGLARLGTRMLSVKRRAYFWIRKATKRRTRREKSAPGEARNIQRGHGLNEGLREFGLLVPLLISSSLCLGRSSFFSSQAEANAKSTMPICGRRAGLPNICSCSSVASRPPCHRAKGKLVGHRVAR